LHAGFTTAVWVLALLSSLNHPAPMLKKRSCLKDISPALKKTKQWKNCLTFENQEAIGEVQEGELSAEEMEDDLAHPMPDLLLHVCPEWVAAFAFAALNEQSPRG
ncbi:kelch domain-containing protein 3-like, partial [Astyanax mexicanus]